MTTEPRRRRVGEYHLTAQVEIDRPAALVWDLIADYRNDPRWRRGVSRMQPSPAGPVRVGTTTEESMRLAGKEYQKLGLVTAVQPGAHYEWRTTAGADASGSRTVTPVTEDRSIFRLAVAARVTGWQRVIGPLLAMMLRCNMSADGRKLKRLAEQTL
jgi:uncharacterized membrane protein